MNDEIRKRIEAVRRGEVPEGYQQEDGYVIPGDWHLEAFSKKFKRSLRRNASDCNNVLTISAQLGLISQKEYYDKDIASEDKSGYFHLRRGEFAYNKSYSSGYPYGAIKRLEKYEEGIVSPLYICFEPKQETNAEFYSHYFEAGLYNREIYRFAQEGARNHGLLNISTEDFCEGALIVPPEEEQQKIADFLAACDRVIGLKQKRVEELKQLKKTCLAKMFPRDGEDVPELRFPGFTAPWEQRRLGDSFSFLQNNTLSRAELDDDSGEAKNVHYGDILTELGEVLDTSRAQLPYISSASITERYKGSLLHDGDVVMADTAEDETAGKCTEVVNANGDPVLAGLHTIPMRPNRKYAAGYLGYYMNSPAYHNQLLPLMQGIKVTSVSKSAILNTLIMSPSDFAEQAAIGRFFIKIDNLINLHQRELEAEQQKKKTLMQLLLTGLVRVQV